MPEANHDVWRHRGLGKPKFMVWQSLDPSEPRLVYDLARVLHRKPRTILLHLSRLAPLGLAVRQASGWIRGQVDLDSVARELGVAGEGERQRWRHERERADWRIRCSTMR
jgi:hypothetical protein